MAVMVAVASSTGLPWVAYHTAEDRAEWETPGSAGLLNLPASPWCRPAPRT
jgi:hypothetical protein